jgi:hypothetical protein
LQQVIGRGGGIWREGSDALHVLVLTDEPLGLPIAALTTDGAERVGFQDRQIAAGAVGFECAANASVGYPEIWRNAERAQYARRVHGGGSPAGAIAWRYQLAGQGEKPWRVYAPPHMSAEAVRNYVERLLGTLATFGRADLQPEGALKRQSKSIPSGNSMHFGIDAGPEAFASFVWKAWQPWEVGHPPDG